ncbi:hypothetical protein [Amycolatopsis minnesotensis]|uniref:Uncharacterized protein n=1 Tax=Amycolatopsis minnesotensis TaxID=337894 RepID=A0ABP5BTH2_9PSEU
MGWLRRLMGDPLPDGFPGALDADEHALAAAAVTGGGHAVVTALGLWVPSESGARRIGWHLISKAAWTADLLAVTEADETGTAGDAVLLTDREPLRLSLPSPGKVPLMIRQRVDGSIRSRHRQELDGGGVWFVQRKVPGRDGVVLQVRADPGVDATLVEEIARDASAKLANPGS